MSSFVRESKFRHLLPELSPRDQWYENLNISDTNVTQSLLACSHHFFAHAHGSANGNAVCVLPLSSTGKNHVPISATAYQVPLIQAGTGKISAVAFDPFQETRLFTAAEDGVIKVWELPEEGLSKDLDDFQSTLYAAHEGRLSMLAPHLAAHNILASATTKVIQIWDLETTEAMRTLQDSFLETEVQSMAWSYGGESLVTGSKDMMLRIIDARSEHLAGQVQAHQNGRDMKALWAGDSPYLISAGFSLTRNRELGLWDSRNLEAAVMKVRLDSNTGPMFPIFDPDTGMLAVTGRGDTGMKIFEMQRGELHALANFSFGDQGRGCALLPKLANDVLANEVMRILKLTSSSVQPLSLRVPRRHAKSFEQDLFPATFAGQPALSAQDWLGGQDHRPNLMAISDPSLSVAKHHSLKGSDLRAALDAAYEEESKMSEQKTSSSAKLWSSSLANKFKHLRGAEVDLHRTWFNMRVNASAPDGDLLACSGKFFATPHQGAGGAVMVRSLENAGKVLETTPLVAGHRAPVVSLAFSPFDDNLLATGSDDCDIRIWNIPDEGVTEAWDDANSAARLRGHNNGVRTLDFHPMAQNLLVSTSLDNTLALWDIESSALARSVPISDDVGTGGCFNLAFDYKGDSVAAFCRDRALRVFDIRSMASVAQVTSTHAGTKGGRVMWCSRDATPTDVIVTTGWNRQSVRELKVWDPRNLEQPIKQTTLDQGSGALQPIWDEGSGMLLLCGRGEISISAFELVPQVSEGDDGQPCLSGVDVFRCNGFMSKSNPQICCAALPKEMCNVTELEVMKLLRLTTTAVEPINFFLPRAAKLKSYFNDDIFPPARARTAPLVASAWLNGDEAEVPLTSMRPADMPLLSEKPVEQRVANSTILMKKVNDDREREHKTVESLTKMQELALQYEKYNPNESMGRKKGVDAESRLDDDEVADDEWD